MAAKKKKKGGGKEKQFTFTFRLIKYLKNIRNRKLKEEAAAATAINFSPLSERITNVRLPLAKTERTWCVCVCVLNSLYKLHFGVLWHANTCRYGEQTALIISYWDRC